MLAEVNLCSAVLDEPLRLQRLAGLDAQHVPALREPKRVISYGKLYEEVCRAAGALTGLGLLPGERVVLFMHDGVDLAVVLLGALRAGLCPVPVPETLQQMELGDVLADSGAAAVVAHADLCEQLPTAPALRAVLSVGGSRPGQQDFAALCFAADPLLVPVVPVSGAPALLLYQTSPDGRLRAHGYPHGALDAAYRRAAPFSLSAEDRILCTGRLSSSFGLLFCLLFPLRAGAVSFLLSDPGRGRQVFDVLGSFRPTVFCATPTLYNNLLHEYLEMSAPRPAYWKGLRLALSFGEPMPKTVERRVRGVFQVEVLHTYLCAEAFGPILSNRPEEGRSGSCGRPLPGLALRVCDEKGQAAAPAEIGQLELCGELPAGLWCGVTQRLLPQPEGWVTLSDRFFVDEEGYFFHVGRSDGMFKVQGRLVAPREVEQVLLGHPAVWECAAVEDEDEDGLLLVKVYVVLNLGQEPTGKVAQELMDFVKRQTVAYKAPRAVEFVQKLPRGTDGRVQRWRLRSRPPGAPLSPPSGVSPIRKP